MKNLISTILIFIAVLAAVIVGYLQSEKWLKNTAIQNCLKAGVDKFINADGKGGADVPNKDAYKFCLKEIGYKTEFVK